MRSLFVLVMINLLTNSALGVTIEVLGKGGARLFQAQTNFDLPTTVGVVSTEMFNASAVPYEGGVYGISKLYDLGQDIDVLSDNEMKAYGWCFSLDGAVPDTMPDQTAIAEQDAAITWYYSYAHYKDGNWIGQCAKD